MFKRINGILFVICVLMIFGAQSSRCDEKDKQDASHNSQSRPEAQSHPQTQSRPQAQSHKEAPAQTDYRKSQPVQVHVSAPSIHQERQRQEQGPRVYAVAAPATVENDNLFHHQHHKTWQPMYNFYDNQYHFYPYVNTASTVELSADCVSVVFNGQTYYYDHGAFYMQDDQGQYEAVPPPIGIIVGALPTWAKQVEVDGQLYWRCKGAYYVQVEQGYQVVGAVQAPDDGS